MSYFRSYFEKNNTLIKNSHVNTSKNPTTEIFYGSAYSRFIFKVDFTDLKSKVDSGEYVITTGTTHTLHLTNTIFGDEGLKGQNRSTGRERATSFKLEVFEINQFWNEGYGFDYEDGVYDFTAGNKTFSEVPSNWFHRTTLDEWSPEGGYGGTGTTIGSHIEFDNGNEHINFNITEYVNNILTGGTNNGLGIKFINDYEALTPGVDKSVSFFTKYTQTFFEPYVETYFDDTINDDRLNFVEKAYQNLYLYVTKGSNFYDLDDLPIVDITNSTGGTVTGLGDLSTTKIKKGIYKVTFGINGVLCDGKRFYFDKWKNLSIDGVSITDVTQKFIPKPYTSIYTIGENQTELNSYAIQYSGIKQNEKIIRGEKRKVVIIFKSISNPKSVLFDEVYYRMFIKEGRTEVIIHDWTQTDVTNENSFTFDTSFYIPREYFIEIKGKTHTEEIFYPNIIKFEIVSER